MVHRGSLLAVLLLAWTLLGCAPERGLAPRVDPGTIRFSPLHTQVEIAIRNPGPLARPIRDIRIGGDDWDALRFADEQLPRVIPAHDAVTIRLRLSPAKFLDARREQHREGHATLEFESETDTIVAPIVFEPTPPQRSSIAYALVLGVALAGLALIGVPRSTLPGSSRVGLVLACMGVVASACMLPLAGAWCSGALAEPLGPLALAQCRAGLGGHALVGFAAAPTLGWLLVALACATLGRVLIEPRAATALWARWLGFGLLIAALVAAAGSAELEGLVLAQQRTMALGELALPRLGVLVQPLAFVLGLVLVAAVAPAGERLSGLERIDLALWSLLIVVLFLGAGALPGLTSQPLPPLLHGVEIAVTGATALAELALVMLAIRSLQRRSASRPASATLQARRARRSLGLALANLLVTVSLLSLVRIFG
jgi:hypothetical protein